MHWKYLVIGPGAMGFFAYLGAASCLWDKIKDIDCIAGSSCGSILAFLMSLGKTPREIYDLTIDLEFIELFKPSIKNMITTYGTIDHSQIRQSLVDICERDPTFSEIQKDLYISAYNLTYKRIEYFSKYTHPDMKVIDAVCASISVPFVFAPFVYNDSVYVDGAINEVYPLGPFMNKLRNEVLILHVQQTEQSYSTHDFFSYVTHIVVAILASRNDYNIPKSTILVDSTINLFDFKMPNETKDALFNIGFQQVYNL